MTKQSAEVFLEYISDLAKEANMKQPTPNNMSHMIYVLEVIVMNGKIYEIRMKPGSEGKIRPQ